ncbi:MAG: sialate O-acetylesterase [Paludibacter sp.]|nr:sialate O-acetylesterase [Paludibacter sp.]
MKTSSSNIFRLILLFCVINVANIINAQTLFLSEDFNLVSGTNLAGQNDWTTGTSATNRVVISDSGLSYPDYPGSGTGLAAGFTPTTDRVQKTFTATLTGTYYYSFLINVNSAGSGDFFIGLYSNGAFRGRAYLKSGGTGFQFGLTKTTTGTVTYTSGTPYVFGTTYLVVVKYEFLSGSGTDDKVSLFVNPDLKAGDPGTPSIGPLTDAGNDVSANVLAIQGRANSGNFKLDGIRVTPDWASIKGEAVKNQFIELPKFISPNMVLQRETPLKFNGWGSEGDTVKVEFDRQGVIISDSAVIDQNGRWNLELPAQQVSSIPCSLKFGIINNPNTLQILDNILVGDVWFAGGQSNMEKKVSHLLEATEVIAEADNYPLIRSFRASYLATNEPQERVNGSSAPWFVCNSTEVGDKVSAVAYIFAREINKSQNIPIGIIQSYRGGTELETWMSNHKITTDPELCKVAGRIAGMDASNANSYPSTNYNGQIHPLTGFPIKGFIYYQGESNTKRALEYRLMMKKLIEDWRSLWAMGNLPFYYVQMFNMGISANQLYEEGNWQDIREQQEQLLTVENIPNIGMAVSIDTNEDPDNSDDLIRIHPKNKLPVGKRLAYIALKNTYNQPIVGESPILTRYYFSNDSAYLVFKNTGSGLKFKTGDTGLKGFAIAAADKVFKSATAKIINDSTIVLNSNQVTIPVAIRYGWAKNPVCNLQNSEDLPAGPFRTDSWVSGYSYSPGTSTCQESNDASLVAIKINGVKLPNFQPGTLSYYLSESFQKAPQITGFTNNPYASITSAFSGSNAQQKATLAVTSENGTKQYYEINFNLQTAVSGINSNERISLYRKKNSLIIENRFTENADIRVYNITGQTVFNGEIAFSSEREVSIGYPGVYFIHFNIEGKTILKKILL